MKARSDSAQLSQRAYTEIKQMIRALQLQPGSSVLQTELAEMLSMSRTPIHNALVRLESEGWVRLQGRQGAQVLYQSAEDMQEIYELQDGLEGIAVQLVTERAADEDLDRLEATVARMEAAIAADDLQAWQDADAEFHRLIYLLSGNKRIAEILTMVQEQSDHVRALTIRLRPKPVRSTYAHRAVIQAMRLRDAGTARSLHQAHRASARKEIVAILKTVALPSLPSRRGRGR